MRTSRIEARAQVNPPAEIDKETAQKNLKIQQSKDAEIVRGRFRYFELPGGAIEFVYKCYKNEEVKKYTFLDGEVYSIPLGVARHLNKNCWYAEYGYLPTLPGNKERSVSGYNEMNGVGMRMARKIQRMGFESLEFTDVEDVAPMASPIITLETA